MEKLVLPTAERGVVALGPATRNKPSRGVGSEGLYKGVRTEQSMAWDQHLLTGCKYVVGALEKAESSLGLS